MFDGVKGVEAFDLAEVGEGLAGGEGVGDFVEVDEDFGLEDALNFVLGDVLQFEEMLVG